MTINEKSPAGAANTNEGNKQSGNNSIHTVYILKHSESTRHTFGTWSGEDLPRKSYIAVLVSIDAVAEMHHYGPQLVGVNSECTEVMSAEARRRKQAEARDEQCRREEAAKRQEEHALIKNITGLDLSRDDLVVFMTQARRDGEDFQPFLDALQAIDDLDLERAGLTTWDVDLDALEEGGDDV